MAKTPWSPRLELEFPAPFERSERPGSPPLDRGPALRITAVDLTAAEGKARFTLLATYAFPFGVWEAYHNLDWAITLVIEDASSGRSAGVSLRDTRGKFAPLDGPNLKGPIDPSKKGMKYGYRTVPVAVGVEEAPAFHPSLFVHLSLRQWSSNTLALDLAAGTVVSN